jgi:hypothetical protein
MTKREAKLVAAVRNVDELDLIHLERWLPDSGHGRFWKAVAQELREAIRDNGEQGD